jgi:hypothetical protein
MGHGVRLSAVAAFAALGLAVATGTASAAISSLTVNPKAQLSSDHALAYVTGTVTCDAGNFVSVNDTLFQTQGRSFAQGGGGTQVLCDGAPDAWTITTAGFGITWLPGRAAVNVVTFDTADFTGIGVHSNVILSP